MISFSSFAFNFHKEQMTRLNKRYIFINKWKWIIFENLCVLQESKSQGKMDGNSTKESDLCLTRSQSLYNGVKSIENQGYEPPRMKQEMRMENEHKRKKKGPNSFSHKSFIPSFGFAFLLRSFKNLLNLIPSFMNNTKLFCSL